MVIVDQTTLVLCIQLVDYCNLYWNIIASGILQVGAILQYNTNIAYTTTLVLPDCVMCDTSS